MQPTNLTSETKWAGYVILHNRPFYSIEVREAPPAPKVIKVKKSLMSLQTSALNWNIAEVMENLKFNYPPPLAPIVPVGSEAAEVEP